MIDPLAIASLGRITSSPNTISLDGIGYSISIEEELVTSVVKKVAAGGGYFEQKKKTVKKIKLSFLLDGKVEFTKQLTVKDIKAKVQDVKLKEGTSNVLEVKLLSNSKVVIREVNF